MLVTLVFPNGISQFIPDIPSAPRGQHPVLKPDANGLVTIDTTKIPLIQLLAAGFSPNGGYTAIASP